MYITYRKFSFVSCLILLLLFGALFVTPVAAASGWMFRADPAHSGVYDDGGIRPDGKVRWQYSTFQHVTSSPAVANSVVYIGSNNGNIYTLNAANGSRIWEYSTYQPVLSSPAVVDGVVYIGGNTGNIYALKATDGSRIWEYSTYQPVSSSPAVVDGVVYIGSDNGNIYALKATDGSRIWEYSTYQPVTSSPSVAEGVVYIGSNNGNIYALKATDGSRIWEYSTYQPVSSSPAVANGVVYIGSNNGNIYALKATDGSRIWEYSTYQPVSSSPAVANGVVYIGSNTGNIYALKATDGSRVWEYSTYQPVTSSPAVANGVVYIGSNNGNIYALNATNGSHIWEYSTFDDITSSPVVAAGFVYIGSNNGNIYALGNLPPVSAFTEDKTQGKSPLSVQFTDRSTENINSWLWDFGDGTTSTVKNPPVHLYTAPGKYSVNLTVYGPGGTSSLEKKDLIRVTFDISGTPRLGYSPLNVTFSDTLTGSTVGRVWDFGDGATSTEEKPIHTYTTPGVFSVKLTVTGPGGTSSVEKPRYIRVTGGGKEGWKAHSDLQNSGVYDGGGVIPNSEERWTFREYGTDFRTWTGVSIAGGFLYVGETSTYYSAGTCILYAIDANNGMEKWSFKKPGGEPGEVSSTPAIFSGLVYVGSTDKNLYAIDANTGSEKWRFGTGGSVISSPTVANGVVYFGSNDKNLYAIDANTGTKKWQYGTGGPVSSSPAVANGVVYFGSNDKNLYAIDANTGTEKWRYAVGSIPSDPAFENGIVYIGGSSLRAIDGAKGVQLFVVNVGVSTPAVADGLIIAGSGNGLLAFDAYSGAQRWVYKPNYDPDFTTGVAVAEGFVYSQHNIYTDVLYLHNGTLHHQVQHMYAGGMAISNGVLYVPDFHGLYAYGKPSTSFSANPTSGTAPLTVNFTGTSDQGVFRWLWDFGDGTTSTAQNPVHTYALPGNYNVNLSLTDKTGQISQVKKDFIHVSTNLSVGSVSPNQGMRGNTVPLTITGTNFDSTMSVNLTRGSYVLAVTDVVAVNKTTMTCVAAVRNGVENGLYSLFVTRGSDGNIARLTDGFMVHLYPAPVIETLTPNTIPPDSIQKLTLIGNNFRLGVTVVFRHPTAPPITATAIPINETEIILSATFPASGIGSWNVSVRNMDGGMATLTNALVVIPMPPPNNPDPIIRSVAPKSVCRNCNTTLTVTGDYFPTGAMVFLTRNSSADIPVMNVTVVNATRIVGNISLPGGRIVGNWDIVVSTPQGRFGVKKNAISIKPWRDPHVAPIKPNNP
jgi:outer membrane protein assembly factor BamB